jgi:hypothetical protein
MSEPSGSVKGAGAVPLGWTAPDLLATNPIGGHNGLVME